MNFSVCAKRVVLAFIVLFNLSFQNAFALQDPMFEDQHPLNVRNSTGTSVNSISAQTSNSIIIIATNQEREAQEAQCELVKKAIWNVLYSNVHCVTSKPEISVQSAINSKIKDSTIVANTRFIFQIFETNTDTHAGEFVVTDTRVIESKSSALIGKQRVTLKNVNQIPEDFYSRQINRLIPFFINQKKIKSFWTKQAASLTQHMTYNPNTEKLYFCEKKIVYNKDLNEFGQRKVECEDGSEISPELAEKRILSNQEGSESPNYLRAALELSTVIGISAYWYFSNEEVQDWAYHDVSFSKHLKNKFVTFEAWKYDDNSYHVNLSHIFPAGWAYYGFARANGISAPWSLLISFLISTFVWESGVEFREVTSINDVIFTPLGGFVIAESGYQFAKALKSQPGVLNQVLGSVLDPFTTFNDIIDSPSKFISRFKFQKPNPNALSGIEFQPDFFSEMRISLGVDAYSRKGSDEDVSESVKIGISGEKINIPAYLTAGSDRDYFTNVLGSVLEAETSIAGTPNRTQIYIQNLLSGYYAKSISKGKDGLLRGYSLIVSPSMGLSINNYNFNNNSKTPNEDFSAILHVLGATGKLILLKGRTRVTFDIGFSGDLAMIKSYAVEKFKSNSSRTSQISSFVNEHEYTHSLGWTVRAGAKVENSGWKAGIGIVLTRLWDINPDLGVPTSKPTDVTQSSVNIYDEISKLTIFLGKDITENLEARIEGRMINRFGKVDNVSESTDDYYGGLQLSYKTY